MDTPGPKRLDNAAGQHIALVDMSQMPVAYLGSDNVHPNDQGYAYLADVWYSAIGEFLPPLRE